MPRVMDLSRNTSRRGARGVASAWSAIGMLVAYVVSASSLVGCDARREVEGGHSSFVRRGAAWAVSGSRYRVAAEGGAWRVSFLSARAATGEAVAFSTRSVGRDGTATSNDLRSERVSPDGRLTLAREAWSERLRPVDEGVEQSWLFPTRPPGSGSLRVRVGVGDARVVDSSPTGLRLVDTRRRSTLRYGVATWIDADGRRTPARLRGAGDEIEIEVPARVLEASRYPAVLDPIITAESVTDEPVHVPVPGRPGHPGVACGPTNCLAVWADQRDEARSVVYGARLDGSGRMLDPGGIPIGATRGDQTNPVVGYAGGHFLVAWGESPGGAGRSDILAARVSDGGAVLDSTPIIVSAAAEDQVGPTIACTTAQCLVAWSDFREGVGMSVVYAARVSRAGAALDAGGFAISRGNDGRSPVAASDGTDFLVTWVDSSLTSLPVIRAARVTAAGTLSDPSSFLVSGEGRGPISRASLAYDGSRYVVAWEDSRSGSFSPDTYATRITRAGLVMDPSGILVRAGVVGEVRVPIVTSVGTTAVIIWQEDTALKAARLDGSGTVLDPGGRTVLVGAPERRVVAALGSQLMLVWAGSTGGGTGSEILGVRVDESFRVLDSPAVRVATVANAQTAPAVAFGGGNYLAVWQDNRNPTSFSDIFGARIDAAGVVRDARAIPIASTAASEFSPAVASDGSQFLVAWATSPGSYLDAVRVSAAGVVDATPMHLASVFVRDIVVASDGTQFLVVFTHAGQIDAVRVSAGGALLDTTPIEIFRGLDERPTVAWSGGQFLVAWSGSSVSGMVRVSPAGVVLGAPTFSSHRFASALAGGGGIFFLVWVDTLLRGAIMGARISPSGEEMDRTPLMISDFARHHDQPRVTFDGLQFVVTYHDKTDFDATQNDVKLVRVLPDGTVRDRSPIAVSESAENEREAAVASSAIGRSLVAYQRDVRSAPFNTTRVRFRAVGPLRLGEACVVREECSSGFCVDGVCCDSACGGTAVDCQACSVAAGAAVDGTCVAARRDTTCRPAAAGCDQSETCDGTSLSCPADSIAPAGTMCRPAVSVCDLPERCGGTSRDCPTDVVERDGVSCAGLLCPGAVCRGGRCAAVPGLSFCNDFDPCTDDFCESDRCVNVLVAACGGDASVRDVSSPDAPIDSPDAEVSLDAALRDSSFDGASGDAPGDTPRDAPRDAPGDAPSDAPRDLPGDLYSDAEEAALDAQDDAMAVVRRPLPPSCTCDTRASVASGAVRRSWEIGVLALLALRRRRGGIRAAARDPRRSVR